MGALPANLSIGSMFRVLALLCLAVLSLGEPEPEAKAVADPKADPYLLYGGYYGLGHYGGYYGYPYYGYYGKRSADAEPVSAPDADAKAEANPWYGYYGHGLVTMVLGTMATMAIPTCMARGLLMLSLFLLLMLMPKLTRIFFMATMGLDTDITGATVMVTATRTTAATTMASKKGRDPIES